MRRSRFIRVLLAAALVVAGFSFYQWTLHPALLRRQAYRLCADFEREQKTAISDKLQEILDSQELDATTGDFVLRTLTQPQLIIRENYAASGRARVAMRRPAELHFQRVLSERNSQVSAGGQVFRTANTRSSLTPGIEYFDFSQGLRTDGTVAMLNEPGEYSGTIEIVYSVIEGFPRHLTWHTGASFPWNLLPEWRTYNAGRPRKILYTCKFELPVKLNVVSRDALAMPAETSNVELDAKIKKSFLVGTASIVPPVAFGPPDFGGVAGFRRPRPSVNTAAGLMEVKCPRTPIALPLRAKFKDDSGREYSSESFGRLVRPERPFTMTMHDVPDILDVLAPGRHTGELILYTDKYLACEDPLVTNVWSGSVRLPVDFTVTPLPTNHVTVFPLKKL